MPRGSDFEARWNEGSWAELRIIEALNNAPDLHAVPFGISDGTPFWSATEMAARDLPDQNQHGKRPDVLVFHTATLSTEERTAVDQLAFVSDDQAEPVTRKAIMAIESEFSPYAYQHRLEHYKKGLSFTIKDEDLAPLRLWQEHHEVPLYIAQIFLDSSYILPFRLLLDGIADRTIKPKIERAYNKTVYYPPMSSGLVFGTYTQMPTIAAKVILDKYGKYTAHRSVDGGLLELTPEMQGELRLCCLARGGAQRNSR